MCVLASGGGRFKIQHDCPNLEAGRIANEQALAAMEARAAVQNPQLLELCDECFKSLLTSALSGDTSGLSRFRALLVPDHSRWVQTRERMNWDPRREGARSIARSSSRFCGAGPSVATRIVRRARIRVTESMAACCRIAELTGWVRAQAGRENDSTPRL